MLQILFIIWCNGSIPGSLGGKVRTLIDSVSEKILGAQGQGKVDTCAYFKRLVDLIPDRC